MAGSKRAPSPRKTAPHTPHPNGLNHPAQPQRHDVNGIERARVTDIQRARMLNAMAQVACERGASNVTVAHVVERAGVSRRTFYEIFTDVEDCFLAAFDVALGRAYGRVRPAYEAARPWRARIRAALIALLDFLDADRSTGRLLIVEAAGYGIGALRRRQDAIAHIVAAVEEGRSESKAAKSPPPLAGEAVVGAVFSIVHDRMLQDGSDALVRLVNPLMSIIVLPYLGAAAARRELQRPAPATASPPAHARGNTLRTLDIRLTYRTVSVLAAVADNPGSSNKRVATAAGISDQGQISKLLARLERLGLVENAGPGSMRGEPNAWRLTPSGEEVHASIANTA